MLVQRGPEEWVAAFLLGNSDAREGGETFTGAACCQPKTPPPPEETPGADVAATVGAGLRAASSGQLVA